MEIKCKWRQHYFFFPLRWVIRDFEGGEDSSSLQWTEIFCRCTDKNYFVLLSVIYSLQSYKRAPLENVTWKDVL